MKMHDIDKSKLNGALKVSDYYDGHIIRSIFYKKLYSNEYGISGFIITSSRFENVIEYWVAEWRKVGDCYIIDAPLNTLGLSNFESGLLSSAIDYIKNNYNWFDYSKLM